MLCLFILACVLYTCGLKKNQNARDAGMPYSDWGKATTGSAKYLDGDTVLVSIFLEDKNASWTSDDKKLVAENMDVAVDYLKNQGEKYGKRVNLIYDLEQHPDLEYHMKYEKAYEGISYEKKDTGLDDTRYLFYYAYEYIKNNIPIKDIMEKYQVNSIGFLIFIDSGSDMQYTYQYNTYYRGLYYTEVCCISLRAKSNNSNASAETYAHEILHLFGARDLYCSNIHGISKDFVDYVAEQYSTDIMLGPARMGISMKKQILGDITDVTAYFLGWKESIPETVVFPNIKVQYPATVSMVTPDYEPYEFPRRLFSLD